MIRDSNRILIRHCEFINNTAENGGGALGVVSIHKLDISNSNFDGNSASKSGGAIIVQVSNSTCQKALTITSSNFIHNKALQHGGALAIVPGHLLHRFDRGDFQLKIFNSHFHQNSGLNGGALLVTVTQSMIMRSSTFCNNYAYFSTSTTEWKGYGGAIYLLVFNYYQLSW